MTLRGDLATLELVDIVQNLEMHHKSGVLAVEGPRGAIQLYVERGAVALVAAPGRPGLMEDLARAGLVSEEAVESARKSRWRTRKTLGEVLVKRKLLSADALREFALGRLREDLCDFLALRSGAFSFTAGKPPSDVFDPDERALELALPIGPALFEAAKRMDHMPGVRSRVPSDCAHFWAPGGAQPEVAGDPELVGAVLELLDGTRSVRAVLQAFPHRRFDVYEALAGLVEAQAIRTCGPDDMETLARELAASGDAERAWQAVQDGLAASHHHLGLLRAKVELAEARRDPRSAAEAQKLIAHVALEAGDRPAALSALARAAELDPEDASILERSLSLALEDGRSEDALEQGLRLVQLYRGPGLHNKAVVVLESLTELEPESWDLQRALARERTDSGDTSGAVDGLERYGKKLLAREEYKPARAVQQEILKLVPGRKQAQKTLESIDLKVYERRRARRRLLARRAALALAAAGLAALFAIDARARLDYARAEREVSRRGLIEERAYGEAALVFESVRAEHPFSLTALLELRWRLAGLADKARVQARQQPAQAGGFASP